MKPILTLLVLLGCGGARAQQPPPPSRPLPLDYFVREIQAAFGVPVPIDSAVRWLD